MNEYQPEGYRPTIETGHPAPAPEYAPEVTEVDGQPVEQNDSDTVDDDAAETEHEGMSAGHESREITADDDTPDNG